MEAEEEATQKQDNEHQHQPASSAEHSNQVVLGDSDSNSSGNVGSDSRWANTTAIVVLGCSCAHPVSEVGLPGPRLKARLEEALQVGCEGVCVCVCVHACVRVCVCGGVNMMQCKM